MTDWELRGRAHLKPTEVKQDSHRRVGTHKPERLAKHGESHGGNRLFSKEVLILRVEVNAPRVTTHITHKIAEEQTETRSNHSGNNKNAPPLERATPSDPS